ncbi:MAG: DEAD/DEAH box helicase [Clostridiales bacterium]|nr:DEAD/DEAH box helicase [Clostridiales bacterium]
MAKEKKNFVVVTPTASGKTLCYNIPVLSAILSNPESRALYLFPTKALSADQVSELYDMIQVMDLQIKTYTYDGDTPASARKAIRQAGHIVVTNPDMLHSGILPQHTKWIKLFENLRYIVIDEIHAYRGLFGSNLANVIRRLLRICAFYGSHPSFILCSATIANPKELASTLIGHPVEAITQNGAPTGKRHFVFYNPPVINIPLGIRKGSIPETRNIATTLVKNQIQTIVFAKSRLTVEILTRYLKDLLRDPLGNSGKVRGYRGGYLPRERREIESGLRKGAIQAVVSTNALELGIDIGSLQASVLCGYPGTVASTWQQAGRAGRRKDTSLTVLVASSAPIDQFIMSQPEYFFQQSAENALINPDNLYILLSHFKCAAYELPFDEEELFGNVASSNELLSYLEESHILRFVNGRYHWMAEDFPASEISLRSATTENFVIIDVTNPGHHQVIGEMDRFTAPMLLHENAIYMHEGKQFQVEKLDFDAHKAFIRHVEVDYYTDADLNVNITLLDIFENQPIKEGFDRFYGEVKITALVKMFKKMKLDTRENLGFGPVMLPETDMHTNAMWWSIHETLLCAFPKEELQNGMIGIANLLTILSPFYLMCSQNDLYVSYQVKSTFSDQPAILLYDNSPGGISLSEKAYHMHRVLLEHSKQLVISCPCESGCPSCVGPTQQVGEKGKQTAISILEDLLK